jgi:2-hydroxy-6-oxonona-2,4-dienedioate hydrolase
MTAWAEIGRYEHRLAYIEAGGIRTRLLEAGAGDPLILLHGTGGHLEAYVRNIGPLSRDFHVFAPDLVGHGYTDKPVDYSHTWSGLAAHVVSLLDALGIDRPWLVGEGVGAQVAQWLALTAPERISGIVLCCTVIVPDDAGEGLSEELRAAQHEFQGLTRRVLETPTNELMLERMRWLFHQDSVVPQELVDLRTEIWQDPDFRQCQAELLRSYVDPAREKVSWADLEGISVPTLVVWGTANRLMPLPVAEAFVRAVPQASLEVLSGAGLWVQYEQAERFNELVSAFVGKGTS